MHPVSHHGFNSHYNLHNQLATLSLYQQHQQHQLGSRHQRAIQHLPFLESGHAGVHRVSSRIESDNGVGGGQLWGGPLLPTAPPVYSTSFNEFARMQPLMPRKEEAYNPFILGGATHQKASHSILPGNLLSSHGCFGLSSPFTPTEFENRNLNARQHGPSKTMPASVASAIQLSGIRKPPCPSQFVPSKKEVFARKVFVGGLPIDVSEKEIWETFHVYGNVLVDWPKRTDKGDNEGQTNGRSMTGYVFLVFEEERSVQLLVNQCHSDGEKYYLLVSSPTMRNKPVQVRPWRLSDMDYMLHPKMPLDARRTVFIGGVPRPTKAKELADRLNILYGTVCYVGIDIDPELNYPKGAARVTFTTSQAFVAAIRGRFVYINHAETQKRVEIKPYVMEEQMCDECSGTHCMYRYAPYFCGDVGCLQYYCEFCWDQVHHCESKKANHRPLVRMGDQTKLLPRPPHHQSRGMRQSHSSRGYNNNNNGSRNYHA